jgi:uncharacterized protein
VSGRAGETAPVGVGLRTPHYARLLSRPRTPVRCLEAISENYMGSEGKPLTTLLALRRDFPVMLHGVSMSLGGVEGSRPGYLQKLKRLAERVEPAVVSDHLCFTGAHAANAHDLLPLPYTEEAIRTAARNIARAQDVLGRRIAIENVSSYLTYADSRMTEWEFLVAVARRADCRILLDVNNAYVSAVNHGFPVERYLDAVPPELVAQVHLGGYSDLGDFLFDTHSRAPTEPVWKAFARVAPRLAGVPVIIEWDEDVPEWAVLERQASRAARVLSEAHAVAA